MIILFGSKNTEKIWNRVKQILAEIQQIGRRNNNLQNILDLRVPFYNKLEKLSGKQNDFYIIRINNQRRIIFV